MKIEVGLNKGKETSVLSMLKAEFGRIEGEDAWIDELSKHDSLIAKQAIEKLSNKWHEDNRRDKPSVWHFKRMVESIDVGSRQYKSSTITCSYCESAAFRIGILLIDKSTRAESMMDFRTIQYHENPIELLAKIRSDNYLYKVSIPCRYCDRYSRSFSKWLNNTSYDGFENSLPDSSYGWIMWALYTPIK